jgi:UTP--glucose-1-phosphate uridylyltransferase
MFTTQSNPIGIADAIGKAEALVGDEPFVVVFGDTIITPPTYLKDMINAHVNTRIHDKNLVATVGMMKVNDPERWGMLKLSDEKIGESFRVVDMIEKPKKEEAPSDWALAGCYVFEPQIFDAIRDTLKMPPGAKGEYQITDSMKILLVKGFSIFALPLNVAHYDLGTIEDYVSTFVEFALRNEKFGPIIREKMKNKNLL